MSEPNWRCKTCKHAASTTNVWTSQPVLQCTHEKINDSAMFAEPRPDELQYSYYESGTFYVGPEFGCVHWEQQEPHHE